MQDCFCDCLQAPRLDGSAPLSYEHMTAFDDLDVSNLNALLDSMDTMPCADWTILPAGKNALSNNSDHTSGNHPS